MPATDRDRVVSERFHALLLGWLGSLPADGWCGPASALFDVLERRNRAKKLFAFVPSGNALSKRLMGEAGFLRANGWRVEFRRTKSARTVHVVKCG